MMKIFDIRCAMVFVVIGSCLGSPPKIQVNISFPENSPEGYILAELKPLLSGKDGSRKNHNFRIFSQRIITSPATKNAQQRQDWLDVDERRGTIKLSRTVDREDLCQYAEICTIQAQIIVLPQRHIHIIEANIAIDDVNDNDPIFPEKNLVLNLTENWPIMEPINLDAYQAEDLDSGNNSKLIFNISSNPYFRLRHFIDESNSSHLQLYLLKQLDYEDKSEITFDIQSSDSGIPQRSATMHVVLTIADCNDNYPEFRKKMYTVTLKEGTDAGYEVIQVSANDADDGMFGSVRYFLSRRNTKEVLSLLKIDQTRGVVSLLRPVDRRAHGGLRVLLEVRDSDPVLPKIGEALLIINVEDINDNTPSFNIDYITHFEDGKVTGGIYLVVARELSTWNFNRICKMPSDFFISDPTFLAFLSENSPKGTYIALVTANDKDFGLNGNVEINVTTRGCELSKDSAKEYFKLSREGYLVTLFSFDRESCSRYYIMLEACDHGSPRRCSKKLADVVILDENEHKPVLESTFLQANVSEDAYIGAVAAIVSARDNDSLNGPALTKNKSDDVIPSRNGDVFYSIVSGDEGVFTIGKRSGKIRLMAHLDREEKSTWKLRISAQDRGTPSKQNFADVVVNVEDVNDNPPQFVNPSINNSVVRASIYKNEAIATLQAIDKDVEENGKVSYSLLQITNGLNLNDSDDEEMISSKPCRNCSRVFVINPNTGELRLNFSNENLTKSTGIYDIEITAADSGDPRLSSVIILRIMVGKYPGKSDNLLTRINKKKYIAILDPFYVSILLGSLAILLLVFVVLALIKCAMVKKKLRYSKKDSAEQRSVGGNTDEQDNGLPYDIFKPEDSQALSPLPDQPRTSTPTQAPPDNEADKKNSVIGSGHSDSDSGKGDSDFDPTCPANSKEFIQRKELGKQCGEECRKYGHGDSCWMPIHDQKHNAVIQPHQTQRTLYHGVPWQRYFHGSEPRVIHVLHTTDKACRIAGVSYESMGVLTTSGNHINKICQRPFERRHSNPGMANAGRNLLSANSLHGRPFGRYRSFSPLNTQSPNSKVTSPGIEQFGVAPISNRSNLETLYESEYASSSRHDLGAMASTHFKPTQLTDPNSSFVRIVPSSRAVPSSMARFSNSKSSSKPSVPSTITTKFSEQHLQKAKRVVNDLENMFL